MNRKKSLGIVGGVFALVVAVVGVSMVWAGFTQNLDFKSNFWVFGTTWDIRFDKLQAAVTGNESGVSSTAREVTAPQISGKTVLENYSVELKTPGDYVSYEFDLANHGSYDAMIGTGFSLPTPTCTGTGDNATTDAANVCKNLSYTLTYKEDGSAVKSGDTYGYRDYDSATDTLYSAGLSSKTVILKISYNKNTPSSELPKNDVTISNLGFTIPFIQK